MKWLEIALGLGVCAGGIYLMFHPINFAGAVGANLSSSSSSSTQSADSQVNSAIAGAIAAAGASEAIGTALTLV